MTADAELVDKVVRILDVVPDHRLAAELAVDSVLRTVLERAAAADKAELEAKATAKREMWREQKRLQRMSADVQRTPADSSGLQRTTVDTPSPSPPLPSPPHTPPLLMPPDPHPEKEIPLSPFLTVQKATVRQRNQYSQAFESAWKLYGRREEKSKAHDAWRAAAKGAGAEDKLLDLVRTALSWQGPKWAVDDWEFAPFFERYLKNKRWEDERPAGQQANHATGGYARL